MRNEGDPKWTPGQRNEEKREEKQNRQAKCILSENSLSSVALRLRTFQMYHSRRGRPDGGTRAEGREIRGNRQRKRRQKIRSSPCCCPKTYFPNTSILIRSCWFGGKNLVDGSHSDCKRKTLELRGNNNLRHEKLSRSTLFVDGRLNLGSRLKTNPPFPSSAFTN